MQSDPSKVTSAVTADAEIKGLHDLLDLSETFAMLSLAHYNTKLENTLWNMMRVDTMRKGNHELMKCTCGKYMHYLICEHVIFWHMLKGQVTVPSNFKMVDHVNKAQKFGTGAPGYPLHMRSIPKNAALSHNY